MHEGRVQFGQAARTGQGHRDPHLMLQQFQHLVHAGIAIRRQGVAIHPPHADRVGPQGDGLHDIRPSAETAIDQHLGAASHRGHHLWQHIHRTAAVIQLPSAMVGHVNPVDAMLAAERRVLAGCDALQDQRDRMFVLEMLHIVPGEPGLPGLPGRGGAPGLHEAPGDVAFPPRIGRRIDGDREGVEAVVDRALHHIVDPGVVASDIELEDLGAARRRGHRFQARMRHRACHDRNAECGRRAPGGRRSTRIERFQGADGCQEHRQAQLAAEQGRAGVDLRYIDANPRAQRDRIERHAVAPQRRLGFRGADQIAPDMVGQLGARRRQEFMQALDIARRLEKVLGFRFIHRRYLLSRLVP